tara:strand:- start:2969 stop:3703 length:735 start_codon:yes stop_codon:yes gene_type:complete
MVIFMLIILLIFQNKSIIETFEPIIPLDLYQTWDSKNLDKHMQECVDKLKSNNQEFNYHFYDDNDSAEFIKDNFDNDIYEAYNTLIPRAFKADLWRYCILYIKGGIYLDIKYFNTEGAKLIDLTDAEYFIRDIKPSGGGVANALLVCKAGNPKLLNCINNISKNVKERYYGSSALHVTGPMLLKKEFTETEINNMRLSLGENDCPTKTCINLDGKPFLAMYNEYYNNRPNPSYYDLWTSRQIYK